MLQTIDEQPQDCSKTGCSFSTLHHYQRVHARSRRSGNLSEPISATHKKENGLPSASAAFEILKAPMVELYSDGSKFKKDLFEALRKCLAAYELQQADDNTIVLNLGTTQEYAVGIALQKSPDQLVRNQVFLTSRSVNKEMDATSVPDHVVSLCQKMGNNNWTVTDCFAVVKLEISNTACESFDFDEFDGSMLAPELGNRHAALGQVIWYNLDRVLLFQAKRGVLRDHIPLAIISARKEGSLKRKDSTKALQWVSGRLDVPKTCGWDFEYSIQSFGHFSKNHKDESVDQALSLYMETILSGLTAAIRVQKAMAIGEIPLSVPASGRALMIGDVALNQLHLLACPIPIAVTWQDPSALDKWKVSQGELFKGSINLCKVLQNPGVGVVDFGVPVGYVDVLVKVSSATVFSSLIRPGTSYVALQMIKLYGTPGLVNEIGSVVYAIADARSGFLTIMRDMSVEGYGALKPVDFASELDVLWDGFQDLVVKVPMAELDIIHADIRPGYDVTSNILCKFGRDVDGMKKATLKLIDFESIVGYRMWRSEHFDDRYIKKEPGWDATTYVWWQCMAVAYSWKEALYGNSLRTDGSLVHLKETLIGRCSGPAWLHKYRKRAKGKITAEIVKLTLVELAEEFSRELHGV